MSSLQAKLQHKYALSEKGAKDMIKAFISVTCSNLVLMFPVWMLYFLVRDYLQGTMAGRGVFYIVGCVLCLLLIALTTLVQYRATFLATYVESGVRRIALAEQLRKIPLSFFGKKDLSDLTSTIMADCATMETASSHFVPELVGSCISTTLIAVSIFLFGLTTSTGWFTYYSVILKHWLKGNEKILKIAERVFVLGTPLWGMLVTVLTLYGNGTPAQLWVIADFTTVFPTFVNVATLFLLSGTFFKLLKDYKARYMGIGKVDEDFELFYEDKKAKEQK